MRVLALVAGVAVILGLVISMRPGAFRIQRRVWIAAAPDTVFSLLDDFRNWDRWSPFDRQDPAMRKTFTGKSGVGASFHYVSRKAGEGRMTVVDRLPNELLTVRAEFIKPFAATNQIDFTLRPERGGTTLTWSMTGHNSFVFKAFGLVVNVDRMVGNEFETGLAYLKRLSEVKSAQRLTSTSDLSS